MHAHNPNPNNPALVGVSPESLTPEQQALYAENRAALRRAINETPVAALWGALCLSSKRMMLRAAGIDEQRAGFAWQSFNAAEKCRVRGAIVRLHEWAGKMIQSLEVAARGGA